MAVEQAKAEAQSASGTQQPEEVTKQHAEELRALEERLTSKHQEELKANAALETVAGDKPPPATGVDQKAAIAAAIEEHEKQLASRHAEEIASAVERGRMEGTAKGKLKDAQLVRAQKKLRELETEIDQWRAAGLIPEAPRPAGGPASTPVSAQRPATAAPPAVAASAAATPATAAPGPSNTNPALPRKPAVPPAHPTAGAGRGAPAIRGAPRVPPRGGAPASAPGRAAPIRNAASAAAAAANAAGAPGMTIMGAAGKRPREPEGPGAADDSLAKRLKPAEATTTAATAAAGKPVTLRRPPPPAPS